MTGLYIGRRREARAVRQAFTPATPVRASLREAQAKRIAEKIDERWPVARESADQHNAT